MNIISDEAYKNGIVVYQRLCNEKFQEFVAYIAISAGMLAIMCGEVKLDEYLARCLPLFFIVITVVFIFMSVRTEKLMSAVKKELMEKEKQDREAKGWYTIENNIKKKAKTIPLFALMIVIYVLMIICAVIIALAKWKILTI